MESRCRRPEVGVVGVRDGNPGTQTAIRALAVIGARTGAILPKTQTKDRTGGQRGLAEVGNGAGTRKGGRRNELEISTTRRGCSR